MLVVDIMRLGRRRRRGGESRAGRSCEDPYMAICSGGLVGYQESRSAQAHQ